jgi:flagellar motor switch protein FliN
MAINVEEHEDDDLFDGSGKNSPGKKEIISEEDDIPHGEVDFIHDVPIEMIAQVGSMKKTTREILSLKSGSVIEFDRVVGEPMDVMIGGKLMCRGEIVVVNEHYGIRISEVIRADEQDTEKDLSSH